MRVWFCTAVVCILQSVSPVAQNQTEPDQPRINTIEVLSRNVFDESSRGISAPYRVANKIHVRTRESVIRRELLFAPGDVLSPELLAQTERNLRALPFLREARVDTIPVDKDGDGHAEGVDVQVVTWDGLDVSAADRLRAGRRPIPLGVWFF